MKRRLAFFTVDWNFELVEMTLQGIQRFVEDHEGVQVCIFDCFGKDTETPKDMAEYLIYSLPDLRGFDGVVVQANQIVQKKAFEELGRRIEKVGLPAVSIDSPMDGCVTLGVDNYQAQKDMTLHVIREHGARNLVYLTGIMDNNSPEAAERLSGFQDACKEAGIAKEQIEIFHGRWSAADGERVAKTILQRGTRLPDAFVCANDEMALGLMAALHEAGVSVPDEVLVVGFDYISSARLSIPSLTTVKRDYGNIAYGVLEYILEWVEKGKAPAKRSFPHELILTESCGCPSLESGTDFRKGFYGQTLFLKNFYLMQDALASQLFATSDLSSLLDVVEKYHYLLGTGCIYLCMNDYYLENFKDVSLEEGPTSFSDRMYLVGCGGKELSCDENHVYGSFGRKELLSREILLEEPFLIFYPLHYASMSIGYIVLNSICEASKMKLHESIVCFIEMAIEDVRKRQRMRELNIQLAELSIRDGLTGLYNRMGFERLARKKARSFAEEKGGCSVLFVDMDAMKVINDQFGHDAGDRAILAAAKILTDAVGKECFAMRYGGDEFMVIAPGTQEHVEKKIEDYTEEFNRTSGEPFHLGLSVGKAIMLDGKEDVEEYLKLADERMYQEKLRKSTKRM
ncbi:MAG: GGDEF domain-containing protein [Blautia sp.]|nr:GGDEF domain-containing protein [Blautia sp.]